MFKFRYQDQIICRGNEDKWKIFWLVINSDIFLYEKTINTMHVHIFQNLPEENAFSNDKNFQIWKKFCHRWNYRYVFLFGKNSIFFYQFFDNFFFLHVTSSVNKSYVLLSFANRWLESNCWFIWFLLKGMNPFVSDFLFVKLQCDLVYWYFWWSVLSLFFFFLLLLPPISCKNHLTRLSLNFIAEALLLIFLQIFLSSYFSCFLSPLRSLFFNS